MAPRRRDTLTSDLFAYEPPKVRAELDPVQTGRGDLGNRIAKVVAAALRHAKDENRHGREKIAAGMTDYLGRKVSAPQLDKWASESAAEHRIPLDAFAALIEATGCTDLLGLLPGLFGFAAVPEQYTDIISLHLMEEHEKKVAREKEALMARIRGRQ